MVFSPGFSRNLFLLMLVILSHMIMVANGREGVSLQSGCTKPTMASCKGKVANECCCKAIVNEINNKRCSRVCELLINYKATNVVSTCITNWKCEKCKQCNSCKG